MKNNDKIKLGDEEPPVNAESKEADFVVASEEDAATLPFGVQYVKGVIEEAINHARKLEGDNSSPN